MPKKPPPPGFNPLICKRCGDIKPAAEKCWKCYKTGRVYRKREPVLESTKEIIAQRRQEEIRKRNHADMLYEQTKRGRLHKNYTYRKRLTNLRKEQLQSLLKLLTIFLSCFERDQAGDYQIYADRMPELQGIIAVVQDMLPQIHAQINKVMKLGVRKPYNTKNRKALNLKKKPKLDDFVL